MALGGVFMLDACSTFKPQELKYASVPVTANKVMDYGVYTPPNWTPKESLPLVLFLHGSGDSHVSFEKYGAHQYFDEQITLNYSIFSASCLALAKSVLPDPSLGSAAT